MSSECPSISLHIIPFSSPSSKNKRKQVRASHSKHVLLAVLKSAFHFGLEFLSDFPDFNWKHWKLKFVTSDFDGKKQGRKMRPKTRPSWGLGNHFCRKVCHGFLISRGKLLGLFNLREFQATFEGLSWATRKKKTALFNRDPYFMVYEIIPT